jgi:MFS family permease
VFHGFALSLLLVSTFADALRTAVSSGFEMSLETYGLISGLWTSVFAFGAFVGPSISGFLFDIMGFRKSILFIISIHAVVAVIFILYTMCSNSMQKTTYKELSNDERLIGKSTNSLHKSSRSRVGSVGSSHHISVPMSINNNMAIASSYSKANHWQRMEESNVGLLADVRDENYGSFEPQRVEVEPYRESIA